VTRGVGIFDDFPGYRVPSDEDVQGALRSALVVLDTNVLLNLYRYGDSTREDMLGVLAGLGERLWVPHQVMREFWRNRLSVIAGRNGGTDQAVTALAELRAASVDTIRRWARTALVAPDERDQFVERIDRLHAELAAALQAHAPSPIDVAGGAMDDPVLRVLESLLDGRVGPAAEPAAWRAAVAEGEARMARREPPGYLDVDKAGSTLPERGTGDYLLWRQAVEEAAARGTDLVLVTADQKADWWWRYGDDLIGPRSELVAEFAAVASGRLFLMRPVDLLRRASVLAVPVRDESVADVEQIAAGAGPSWTAVGVRALLSALDRDFREQAAAIRAAAARGGRLERPEIDEVCSVDDTTLSGFAAPVARVTRDLQDTGLIAPGVEPALAADHHDGALLIPAEITAILSDS
jgi:PIN like domain